MKEFSNDKTKNQYEGAQAHLSKIFSWFSDDFKPTVKDFLLMYVNDQNKKVLDDKNLKIDYLDYDWSLNEQ